MNYGDEYKVMGLASYGEAKYLKEFSKIIKFSESDYFKLNLDYFLHHRDKNFKFAFDDGIPRFNKLYSSKLIDLLGPERNQNDLITKKHKDIAASMQKCFEEIVIKILNKLFSEHPSDNLYLAGGCAFNSKLNGLLRKKTKFKNIFIQPNAGDGGGSIGSALYVNSLNYDKKKFINKNLVYLGPSFDNREIEKIINKNNNLNEFQVKKLQDKELYKVTAKQIIENKVIGWFKGRMEWGPRALRKQVYFSQPNK